MNPKRTALIAGNWKMHHGGASGITLAAECGLLAKAVPHVELLVAPPFTVLAAIAHECEGTGVLLAAQNVHEKDKGAYTGEISPAMLADAGCGWVILGHSERRQLFGETDEGVARKTAAALAAGLSPIVCVGETLAEREANETLAVVSRQVAAVLSTLRDASLPVAIAYEPVWAIGTGKVAGPTEAEEVHAAIRAQLASASADLADRARILYGGSLKPDNAEALLACPNIDGGLIGGASLDVASFGAIARAAEGLAARPQG
jgi:triosephosphate isomerase (TIM)